MDVNDSGQTVTIYPEEGNFPAIARALLEAADDPRDVAYVSHPKAGFIVSEEVYERFEDLMGQDPSSTHQDDSPAQTEPRKRRPGRPRKNPDSQTNDNASKEE